MEQKLSLKNNVVLGSKRQVHRKRSQSSIALPAISMVLCSLVIMLTSTSAHAQFSRVGTKEKEAEETRPEQPLGNVATPSLPAAKGNVTIAPVPATIIAPQFVDISIGTIDPYNAIPIEKTATFTNTAKTLVTVERINTSCGCTAALPDKGQNLPLVLEPGKSVTVQIKMNPQNLSPGELHKNVSLYLKEQSDPAMSVSLKGTLPALIEYDPISLNFGKIEAGAKKELRIRAYLDERLEKTTGPLQLMANNSDISVMPVVATPSAPDGKKRVVKEYLVTLKADATLGTVSGFLKFEPVEKMVETSTSFIQSTANVTGTSTTTHEQKVIKTPAGSGVILTVAGEVTGAVIASANYISFGTIVQGTEGKQTVSLYAKEAKILEDIPVVLDNPLFTAQFVGKPEPIPTGQSTEFTYKRTLEIVATDKLPLGGQVSTLLLSLSNGQRLRLFVNTFTTLKPQATLPSSKSEGGR